MSSLLKLDSELKTKKTKKRKLEDRVADESWQGENNTLMIPEWMMKCNNRLVELIERVQPEIRMLIEKCNTETVTELRTVESEAASYLDQISRYYITRAKFISKIAKYPHVDYRRTLSEIDEKEYISLKIFVSELRNQYVTLHESEEY
ncbi:proteasome activator complex subunit 3-like isoform X5 [Mastacembelus armatus]|uniref:proteasome activator complex subunit 3-like isoform X5 n=1 Tax=Mastacembelus armatus TaxID=205130 RepID=UPI000E4572FF|nr:proteasome activator complex subunit 3-like isoform X5 [Mastacembelus armatus]